MLHEVSVRVKTLRHLPQQFFQDEKERELALSKRSKVAERQQHQQQHGRGGVDHRRCLRAQASISNETRETGNSVWGRGMRSREAMWLRGVDTLSWSLPEQQFKLVKAYTPVCKVHVYAADASSPTMDTCDAVGWFIVDMRDLAGQRQQERWVKLQGASPAEVLVSSSLAMARDRADLPKQLARDSVDPSPRSPSAEAASDTTEEKEEGFPVPAAATPTPTADATPSATATATPSAVATAATATATAPQGAEAPQGPTFEAEEAEVYRGDGDEGIAVLPTSAAEAVSDLEALPVGPGADGDEARTFSLSISVKGAAGLAGLAPSVEVGEGVGFWFSYSIFGVVVQTDRFDRLAAPPPGGGPLLEPMLDSFRLRATLQGLCEFLGEAPPLQVYLCTEGCILAHADVDMSCLLPRGEWATRTTSQFCRTGIEGDFNLHLPGELMGQPDEQREALKRRRRDAVVTIGAELTRIGSTPGDCIRGEAAGGIIGGVKPGAGLESGSGERGSPGMRTWAYLAGKRQRGGVITASLQRLELSPATRDVADRLQGVLVGIHGAEESLPQGGTAAAATMAAAEAAGASVVEGRRGPVSLRGFRVVGCGETGGVETESTSLLGGIVWKWEGNFPPGATGGQQLQGGGSPLAVVRVLGGRTEHDEIAAGAVPWPSPASSGRQHVDVKLMSPDGSEIGSCRVCLGVNVGKGGDVDGAGVGVRDESVESGAESVLKEGGESKRVGLEGTRQGGNSDSRLEGMPARVTAGATVSSKGVQAEELALEGGRKAPGGEVPRSYRLSVNLASVKDLENAAYVVARYHYPYFGTSAPVRTSLVWVAPRMDTPLSNSCCTFSFGMSLDRLKATVQDRKLVVSIRNKDRFKEEEVGLVTLPLQDVVKADPQYFRCRDTNKTFTSMTGFRAHLKSRQRAGEISLEDSSAATPVEVKVLDTYLTVADARKLSASSSPPLDSSGVPARLCSLRVILLLEDMGTTGDPHDKAWLAEEAQHSPNVRTEGIEGGLRLASPSQVAASTRRAVEGPAGKLQGGVGGEAEGVDVERVRREWEQWRLREETAFAKRLREKDQALEDKWEARESARRRDLMLAQTDYSKLEGKLRKALSEVEARERQLKAKEESWRSEHAQKVSELQLLQRRLREETKHQVELERMKVKALEKQVSSHAKALEGARARVTATDEDLERFRQQQRRTPEGGLRQEIFRLGAAKAEAEAQVERERSLKSKALLEKEEYRAHIHKLVRTLRRHQERESTCARRDMEQLRLEYLAREERFMLDGDRNELRTIKQELDELRHVSLVQEAQANLAKVNTGPTNNSNQPPAPTSAPAPAVAGAAALPSSFHETPGMAEFADPGPSPCPPPRPTPATPAPAPAPAPALVPGRREAGSMSRGSGGGATGRGGYAGSSLAASGGGSGIVGGGGGGVGVGGSGASDEEEEEVERLLGWRDDLLATGMYTEQNPIVSEMNRRIAEASRRRAEGLQRLE